MADASDSEAPKHARPDEKVASAATAAATPLPDAIVGNSFKATTTAAATSNSNVNSIAQNLFGNDSSGAPAGFHDLA